MRRSRAESLISHHGAGSAASDADVVLTLTPGHVTRPPLGPEMAVLLCCARTRLDEARREHLRRLVTQGVDWVALSKAASRHGLTALLYWHLNANCVDVVPRGPHETLRSAFQWTARYNVAASVELQRVLRLLEAHAIPVLTYKGVSLARSIYGNLALRAFHDLDLLVQERDFERASQLLRAQGYHEQERFEWESHFVHSSRPIPIDLHRGFTPGVFCFASPFEHLWARRRPLELGGGIGFTLAHEDLLIILCVQAAKDAWSDLHTSCAPHQSRLLSICDIAEVVRANQDLEWHRMIIEARRLGALGIVSFGLSLARELLSMTLPAAIAHTIEAAGGIRALSAHIAALLFQDLDAGARVDRHRITPARFHFTVRERWQDRVFAYGYAIRAFLTPNDKDRAVVPLPRGLGFLAYVIRPLRIAREFGLRRGAQRLRYLLGWGQ
jgi:cell division protein FtsL